MPRPPRSEKEVRRGKKLGTDLQAARGRRTSEDVAKAAGIAIDTLRKIERGGVASPGFFVVARIAAEVGADLNQLAAGESGAD